MDTQRRWLAVSLNWLAAFWLVGWTLYVTFGGDSVAARDRGVGLAVLLIPAAVAFAVSWALDRYAARARSDYRAGLRY